MRTLAHVTHEAIQKVGGIGAVLQGLLTSEAYRELDQRTILIGPFFATEGGGEGRLGPDGEVLYSSIDGITRHPLSEALDRVRREFHVHIVYGHRRFTDPATGVFTSPEVLLIDVSRIDLGRVNALKGRLWQAYKLDSSRYEHIWEYDLYVKLAEPAIACLHALGTAGPNDHCVILAHEFMGMPTALAGKLDPSPAFRSVFYAHEVSAMRLIVEAHPGHDVTFYNALSVAMEKGQRLSDVFGSQDQYYRHALVKLSCYCDKIFAVGDDVAKELRFIGREFDDAAIAVTYNGIPADKITLEQKKASQKRMRDYAETLLGYRPDYVFTHVTRMCVSKALWRDVVVLEQLDESLRKRNQTAVMFVLSTELPGRSPNDIRRMEQGWQWPVAHRELDGDLSHGEAIFYQFVQVLNARCRNVKLVYVNQFGWDQSVCGERMPKDMSILDIRRGSDLEFGQSIYEPFGIAMLEPLAYGGVCVISSVCGCAGFVESVAGAEFEPNVLIADYCDIGKKGEDLPSLLAMTREARMQHETEVARQIVKRIVEVLPRNDADLERLLNRGYELASEMSWEVVAGDYVLPAIDDICGKLRVVKVA